MTEFDTEDKTKDYLIQHGSNGKLTIAFAGLANGLCEVRHDFFNATSGSECSKIFVKDMKQFWYQQGIPEAPSIPALFQKLKDDIAVIQPTEITCIGISAGGYAALLFGSMLDVDLVHAFGPQTFLSRELHDKYNMTVFLRDPLEKLWAAQEDQTYFDLKPFLMAPKKTKYLLHLCDCYAWDTKEACHIVTAPNVELREYTCNEHGPASYLKRNGLLSQVLENK